MTLEAPQVLLLLVPFGLFWWFKGRVPGPASGLRAVVVLLLLFALARPELSLRSAGSDVVVVVDRSRSMPPGSQASAEELVRLVEQGRRPGDRLGVLSFGRDVRVDMPLSAEQRFGGFTTVVDAEASNLAGALDAAEALIPAERSGRVLVLSDGRATGLDARAPARRLLARGVPVDVRYVGRDDDDGALDVAVTGLTVPPRVAVGEPFLLTVTVRATAEADATVLLSRGEAPLAGTTRHLAQGTTTLTFRDLVEAPGLVTYEVRVTATGDGVSENDVGRAVVRVEGPPRVLLVTDKPSGTLERVGDDGRTAQLRRGRLSAIAPGGRPAGVARGARGAAQGGGGDVDRDGLERLDGRAGGRRAHEDGAGRRGGGGRARAAQPPRRGLGAHGRHRPP